MFKMEYYTKKSSIIDTKTRYFCWKQKKLTSPHDLKTWINPESPSRCSSRRKNRTSLSSASLWYSTYCTTTNLPKTKTPNLSFLKTFATPPTNKSPKKTRRPTSTHSRAPPSRLDSFRASCKTTSASDPAFFWPMIYSRLKVPQNNPKH